MSKKGCNTLSKTRSKRKTPDTKARLGVERHHCPNKAYFQIQLYIVLSKYCSLMHLKAWQWTMLVALGISHSPLNRHPIIFE